MNRASSHATDRADESADDQPTRVAPDRRADAERGVGEEREDHVENRDGEDGADGVDQDRLAFEDRLDAPRHAQAAHQRLDDGRAGDGHQGAEEDGERPREGGEVVRGERREHPRDEHADGDEAAHLARAAQQVAQAQVHRPLEEDHRDRELDDDAEAAAERHRLDEADAFRPEGDAEGEQQHDGRYPPRMGEHLGQDTEGERPRDGQKGGQIGMHAGQSGRVALTSAR